MNEKSIALKIGKFKHANFIDQRLPAVPQAMSSNRKDPGQGASRCPCHGNQSRGKKKHKLKTPRNL